MRRIFIMGNCVALCVKNAGNFTSSLVVWQHTEGMVRSIMWVSLEIYIAFQQWKNFETPLRIDKVIAMSLVYYFFGTQCIFTDFFEVILHCRWLCHLKCSQNSDHNVKFHFSSTSTDLIYTMTSSINIDADWSIVLRPPELPLMLIVQYVNMNERQSDIIFSIFSIWIMNERLVTMTVL